MPFGNAVLHKFLYARSVFGEPYRDAPKVMAVRYVQVPTPFPPFLWVGHRVQHETVLAGDLDAVLSALRTTPGQALETVEVFRTYEPVAPSFDSWQPPTIDEGLDEPLRAVHQLSDFLGGEVLHAINIGVGVYFCQNCGIAIQKERIHHDRH